VALDARVQVEFDPDVVDEYRLIGYENRSIDDDDFRDDDVEAGAIGAGHEVTALYAIRLHGDGDGALGTVSLRWHDPETREPSELDQDIRLSDLTGSFERTDASFQLDALVAGTAEWLRDSRYADDYDLRDVLEVADEIDDDLPQTDEVHAFLELLEDAATIER
jgi:Ca-activated chloride channel family protein